MASVGDLVHRGHAYEGMRSEQVDGQDVIAMYDSVARAADRARDEGRPTFMEAITYRYHGHSMSGPAHGTYRTKEEVQRERKNDPIATFCDRLTSQGLLSSEDYDRLDKAAIAASEDAAEFAENSPVPDPAVIYENVYQDEFRVGLDRRDAWR